jgi:starch synthase
LKILFASSEALPLVKTGGLADVAGSLPEALVELGLDVRVALPAYRGLKERFEHLERIGTLHIPLVAEPVQLFLGDLGPDQPPYVLIDAPELYDRDGGPYVDAAGNDHPDNAHRFAAFARVVVALALGHAGDGWRPDLVHTNDWQTGLIPALLSRERRRPATMFTIHNLAYQGVFDYGTFKGLDLPGELWSINGLEFHGNCSFIKGGIAYADAVTTVSPTYAKQICTPALGYGLEGLLTYRADRLFGVLNGIDNRIWDPAHDRNIPSNFDAGSLERKQGNKRALQETFGLPVRDDVLLFGHVGRLVEQKGVDLIIELLPWLLEEQDTQLVVLGSGHAWLERALRDAAARLPDRLGIRIGYDEALSHLVEAGSDAFLMPSRFEPCGLNQMYSQRYGTVPVVHRTGGLADTVLDASSDNLLEGTATGFLFDHANVHGLRWALQRLLDFRHRPPVWWEKLQQAGMAQDFSWPNSARRYIDLYRFAIDHPVPRP